MKDTTEINKINEVLVKILAPNPGIMTGNGTNTYLVGEKTLAVVDPGPDHKGHLETIVNYAHKRAKGNIKYILLTHAHPDHALGTAKLKEMTGAVVAAFGPSTDIMPLKPDIYVSEGFVFTLDKVRLRTLHTPGHSSDHLCFLLEDMNCLLAGDHIMQGSTVVILPPQGDMGLYLKSLYRLASLTPPLQTIAPGHGEMITNPAVTLNEYITHRLAREKAVEDSLKTFKKATIDQLLPLVYQDTDPVLHPIARYSLWAHLRKLTLEKKVTCQNMDNLNSMWIYNG
ncbi:MAG: MBL fold metallo-hydrolase [Actinobacteria bacterium]|jgi:glyoxylase-like metal-dependent hydrolase (beta-lactamase superfamily II)|nr:MBL fold metallo-hydrolase [Actinomycetota bacterium]MCL6104956.1 MBL fold metallo-hydrolase [Actinomycetota bacterium]